MKRKQVVVLEVTFEDDDPPNEWDWEDMANEYDDDENAPLAHIEVIAHGKPSEVKEEPVATDLQSAVAAAIAAGHIHDPFTPGMPSFG